MALPAEKPLPRRYTPEEYIELERAADYKSEYIDGYIYAMAGASPTHCAIAANATIAPGVQLKGSRCRVFSGDLKIATDLKGHYTCADVVIVFGTPRYHDKFQDVLLNPTLVVEVLSLSTEACDRGEKFKRYRRVALLTDYILISQDQPLVEHFSRQGDGWALNGADRLSRKLQVKSLKCTLSLADVYSGISFSRAGKTGRPGKKRKQSSEGMKENGSGRTR
ncbi:MAG TPA: Uma2 family endonuclease [Blastocatellia bacterium]|nr:Uma2 family endonuclease [Blastocatellia bacterium]